MLALIVAFSLGGSIGFVAGCCFRSWLESQSMAAPTAQLTAAAARARESG